MTTFQDVIFDARLLLMTNTVEKISQLQSGINDTVTSLTLKFDVQGIIEGTTLGIDLEELYVLTKAGTVLTVIRGFNGSVKASHSADAVIRINPKFSDYRLGKYVNDSLEDISGDGLFRIKPVEFTFSPTALAYDLNASDLIEVWRVRYDIPGPSQHWVGIPPQFWHVDQNANLVDFPSGKSILIQMGGVPGHLIRVSYKASFASLVNLTDDVEAVAGLHLEGHKLLSLGAAIEALGGREVKRTFLERQSEPRRQEEVPVGGASQAMRPLLQSYSSLFRRERRRLRRRYPDQLY